MRHHADSRVADLGSRPLRACGVALLPLFAAFVASGDAGLSAQAPATPMTLACRGALAPDASAASLAARFGAANVTDGDIDVGEGETEPGTVVFAGDPASRLEVLWVDAAERRRPSAVMARRWDGQEISRWRTPRGVTLGLGLRAIERLNGRPFTLAGFGWDYGGGAEDWGGGRLASDQPAGCRLALRFSEHAASRPDLFEWSRQVSGDRAFPSSHPAMQAIDPTVYQVILEYPDHRRQAAVTSAPSSSRGTARAAR